MHRLVPALVTEMGAAYPELLRAPPLIEATLQQEETRFRQTLDKGLKLLDEATAGMKTGDALRAQGLAGERAGFVVAMAEQKRAARAAWKGSGQQTSDDLWFDIAEESGGTEFSGYASEEGEGEVIALVRAGRRVEC